MMINTYGYFPVLITILNLGVIVSQNCGNQQCTERQFCGNTSTFQPVCVGCNAACYNCTGSGPERCITCASNYYMFNKICRICDDSCDGCTGAGPEKCKKCKIAYYNEEGTCRSCPDDTFGQNCENTCHCLNGPDDCDRETGKCGSWQCEWGWKGPPECQTACEPNFFGINCNKECNCPVNDTCSSINGRCASGNCHPEYGGPACQIHLPKLVEQPKITNNKCGNLTLSWIGWVEDVDIGKGPIAQYLVWQEKLNSSSSWTLIRNISHTDATSQYAFNLTNLDPEGEYRFRIDVRAQDGDKLMEEISKGFVTDYYSVECFKPTTSAPNDQSTTTPFKPPVGSLFTSYKLSVVNGFVQVDWAIDSNYDDVVDSLTLSFAIIKYGDCKLKLNPVYSSLPLSNSTSYTLNSLIKWRTYNVRLVITSSQQNISNVHKQVEGEITTPETEPSGFVNNVSEIAKTSSSFTVSWNDPDCEERGGAFLRYDVVVSGFSQNYSTTDRFKKISGLQTYTDYNVQISYVNNIGAGPLSPMQSFKTGEGLPAAPTALMLTPSIRSVTVSFSIPSPTNGIIIAYDIAYSEEANFIDRLQKPSALTNVMLSDLSPATLYFVKVRARTAAGYGNYSSFSSTITQEDFPDAPTSLAVTTRNESCLGISWRAPNITNGIVTSYIISYQDTMQASKELNTTTAGIMRSALLCLLYPGRRYQIKVAAKTSRGFGDPDHLFEYTEQSTPNTPPAPKKISSTATTIVVSIDPVILTTGPLTAYVIYVHDLTVGSGKRKRATGNPPGVETAILLPDEVLTTTFFTVGDGKIYNGIQNNPLVSGHQYDVYLQTRSTLLGVTKSSYNQMVLNPTPSTSAPNTVVTASADYTGVIIAIIVIIIIILIAIVVICVLYWYRRRRSYAPYAAHVDDKGNYDCMYTHVDDYDPHKYWNTIYSHRESRYIIAGRNLIPPDRSNYDMNGVVESKMNPPVTFQQEFHDLPHGRLASWNVALKHRNQRKNRFPHLLPYDHSRVILRGDENSRDDYINANFIHGYHKQNAYIAAQSPFDEETVLDFWRMINQTNVSVIVMITNIIEDNIVKCTKYWPDQDQGKVTYGHFFLELIDTQEFASYVIRTMKFKSNSTYSSTRVVHIFDFCSWPDHGVPDDPIPLLEMRFKVKEYNSDTPASPLLVHCGTGVGRTGAYIAIDSLLEQYDREGRISISAFVRRLRKDRVQMVRTIKQYIFIYDAIFEAKHAGQTRTGLDLKEKYHLLTRKNPKTKHSYLRDQFECLSNFTRKLHSANCSDALSHINLDKNRFPDVIPTNMHRAVLSTPGGVGRTDYINAVLLDSHRQKDHFIVTQTPLHTTIIDFWKLVYDFNVHTIVMMENYKHEDDTCAEYWPEEKKMKQFEPFFIDSIAVYQQDNITIRHFKIHSMLNPKVQAREIRQFQFNACNDTDFVPKSKSMFLDLFDLVKDWQNVSCEDDCPVIVHCKDGATHSGFYVAISNICDAMLHDGDVDVYHTVRRVKKRRTQIVDLVEQYRFCYKVLWDYMNMRLPGGTLTNMMDHTQADKLYNVGSLSLPSYTSHLEYSQFDYS
ncbi:receptor-type tyrosine-protein phosphatase kappa-like isoform X2 [Mytilus californianus]|uniref:receptor-type tyrosine-protein phosphatase kappa-like isoform X2 n=1 Tax=Mytilus californianus TaxID=6549 RepID=UPI002246FB3A|nr:receptor-type tyrosine-protein phosphatase kappa-like isoform X2 [Mytilus californianus]